MKNKMTDLRNHLFVALERLADPDEVVDIERIKQTAEIARVLVDTAKVEVSFINAVGCDISQSDFIDTAQKAPALPAPRQ